MRKDMENEYLNEYNRRMLRSCQLRQLDILKAIDRVCRRHGIDYWLDGGSCLGAVRHKGFIPWDDDIDIAMRQSDLRRFEEAARKELPHGLVLQTPGDYGPSEPVIKVRDLNSFYVEPGDDFSYGYPKGLFVDIFPMTPYPTVPRRQARRVLKGISKSWSILHKKHYYSLRSVAELFWFGAKYAFLRAVWAAMGLGRGRDVFISNILTNNGYGIMHRRESVFPVSELEFEGCRFLAPHDPDAYLRDLFGDYMEIPPAGKRKIHSVFIAPRLIGGDGEK